MNPSEAQLGQMAGTSGAGARRAQKQRPRLSAAFADFSAQHGGGSVLQVGLRGRIEQALEVGPAGQDPVTSCSLDLGAAKHERYARTDGRQLLYADGEFDFVYGEYLLDHAGGFERQFELLKELNRVARKGVFLAVANRRHPLDMDSGLPLLHWLPTPLWQRVAGASARGRRLLTSRELKHLVSLLPGQPECDIGHIRLLGPKAVFFLMVKKTQGIS